MGTAVNTGLSDERAARLMIALREGRTPHSLNVKEAQLATYFATHSDYAREARPLIEANAKAARLRKGACIRNRTHCVNGHSFAEHGRVAMHSGCGYMTRQCRACELMRARRGDKMKPDVLIAVTAALKKGLTISAITHSGPTRLVKHNTFARYRRENSEFDRFVVDLTKDNYRHGKLLRNQQAINEAKREQANDYYKIRAMLPASFPDKDDVVGDIFEAMLDGSLRREDVKARVQTYIAAHNRMFPTKYAKFGDSPLVSLDEVMFDNGSATRGDTVSRGLWD
jgi:hypothetical protein